MESTTRLQKLFSDTVFHIPQYQRAYSWEEEHLEAFLEDLRQQVSATKKDRDKEYFLGTLLLHRKTEQRSDGFDNYDIVDGQQRLTTSVVFIASALELAEKSLIPLDDKQSRLLRRTFIKDDVADCQKLHTIQEDEPFFQSSIIRTAAYSVNRPRTASTKLLDAARTYFQKYVEPTEWPSLLDALRESRVMVYAVNTSADATQIFELQNDRGKRLTDLEAVKSFLMHAIYLNAQNTEDKLLGLQANFACIFRAVEELDSIIGAPGEDAILSYYCAAFASWKNDEWRNPKKLAKSSIAKLSREGNEANVIKYIEEFVGGLVHTFDNVKDLMKRRDVRSRRAFSDLFVLGRLAPFWPLLIKTWQLDKTADKDHFEAACRLMEIYSFRGYGMSNMRSDGGQAAFYSKARDFSGNFPALLTELKQMCEWYNIPKRFLDGLDNPQIYETDERDVRYLLWRYENHLRGMKGKQGPALSSWKDYVEPEKFATSLCVEHITARADPVVDLDVEWTQGEPKVPFADIALNRLGNLVLDSVSPNAAKGKKEFRDKRPYFEEQCQFLSQQELHEFTIEKDAHGEPIWEVQAIKKRHKALVEFAQKEWDFTKINCPANSNTP